MALRNIALVGNSQKYKVGARSTFKRKNQLIAAFFIALALIALFTVTAKPAPIWNSLGPGEYILSGDAFIVGGWGAVAGKYYKVTAESTVSDLDASNFEVSPAGFPIGFTFVDKGYGINTFDFLWFFVDLIIWFIFIFIVIYKFGFFEKQQTKRNLKQQP